MRKHRKNWQERKEDICIFLALFSGTYLLIGAMIAWKIIFRQ